MARETSGARAQVGTFFLPSPFGMGRTNPSQREDARAKRLKKIKSKTFNRIHRKQREKEDMKEHEARLAAGEIDYKGFVIDDVFVVGYGLDYAERYRNLSFIGVMKGK